MGHSGVLGVYSGALLTVLNMFKMFPELTRSGTAQEALWSGLSTCQEKLGNFRVVCGPQVVPECFQSSFQAMPSNPEYKPSSVFARYFLTSGLPSAS